MILESVEDALTWAREARHLRQNRHQSHGAIKKAQRFYNAEDVFIIFKRAWENKKISDFQYRLFEYVSRTGHVQRDRKVSEQWEKMMEVIEPMMIEKGILGKHHEKEYA